MYKLLLICEFTFFLKAHHLLNPTIYETHMLITSQHFIHQYIKHTINILYFTLNELQNQWSGLKKIPPNLKSDRIVYFQNKNSILKLPKIQPLNPSTSERCQF